jgi:hypothetical protein
MQSCAYSAASSMLSNVAWLCLLHAATACLCMVYKQVCSHPRCILSCYYICLILLLLPADLLRSWSSERAWQRQHSSSGPTGTSSAGFYAAAAQNRWVQKSAILTIALMPDVHVTRCSVWLRMFAVGRPHAV